MNDPAPAPNRPDDPGSDAEAVAAALRDHPFRTDRNSHHYQSALQTLIRDPEVFAIDHLAITEAAAHLRETDADVTARLVDIQAEDAAAGEPGRTGPDPDDPTWQDVLEEDRTVIREALSALEPNERASRAVLIDQAASAVNARTSK